MLIQYEMKLSGVFASRHPPSAVFFICHASIGIGLIVLKVILLNQITSNFGAHAPLHQEIFVFLDLLRLQIVSGAFSGPENDMP